MARRSRHRALLERAAADRRAEDHDCAVGRSRRARGRSAAPAAGADLRDRLEIGQPDAVLEMQEDYPLPASGEIPYVYFEVPANYDEDRWVKAFEVRPGNPAAVHHVIVYVRPPADPAATNAPARPRPRGTVTFAEGMDIPAGQTGGPELPEGQQKPAFGQRPPEAEGHDRIARRLRARQRGAHLPRGHRDAPAEGRVAGVPDALHDHRQSHDRSHAHGPHLRQGAAAHGPGRHGSGQRRAAHSRRRRRSPRRRGDDAESRPAALQHDAAHPRPRRPLVLRGGLSRRPARAAALGAQLRLRVAARLRVREPLELPAGTTIKPRRGTTTRRRTSRIPTPPRTSGGATRPGKR